VDCKNNLQQLRASIIDAIASGKLREGDELPSARSLAVDIGVNMHTINKTYSLLRQEGYVTLSRQNRVQVAAKLTADGGTLERIGSLLADAAREARGRRLGREEFLDLCMEKYDSVLEGENNE
jgi:DNA-binding transcriptional regulator YhcF (GntR family)